MRQKTINYNKKNSKHTICNNKQACKKTSIKEFFIFHEKKIKFNE